MTEGFGAFRDAISSLERAAGGGSLDDGFAANAEQHPPGPGYVQAEDGSWVPPNYWDDPPADGMTAAEWFTAQPDDYRFDNMDSRPEADPGYAWAEDGTQVPLDYWD
ncbi:MAG: hypothetical protein M3P49_10985 [Actinomycetota bacterium]|nr:hypothetical protein [Actinomycetota bacterium]